EGCLPQNGVRSTLGRVCTRLAGQSLPCTPWRRSIAALQPASQFARGGRQSGPVAPSGMSTKQELGTKCPWSVCAALHTARRTPAKGAPPKQRQGQRRAIGLAGRGFQKPLAGFGKNKP